MATKRKKKRKKKPAKSPLRLLTAPLLILAAALLLWYAYAGFSDRHWHNYREAGNRAYARGNYAWAAKMYSKALKEARDLDPYDPRVVKSLVDLSKTYKAQNRNDLANLAIAQARKVRAHTK
jgi:hypothetical protein